MKKTADSIEKAIRNTDELISEFNKYQANRNEISLAISVVRMLTQRTYDVFTDQSEIGRNIQDKINDILNWRTFMNGSSWAYSGMVSDYSVLKKAEKSVLSAYKKAWYDDISDIVADIDNKIASLQARSEQISTDEYKNSILAEIEAEMDAKKAIRGDLDTQVSRFSGLNYILSYLSDNTDREGCPIPTEACCSTHGIDVIHQDKTVYHQTNVIPEEEPQAETSENDEISDAIEMLTELLPSLKGKDKKECKEAIEMLTEMLPIHSDESASAETKLEKLIAETFHTTDNDFFRGYKLRSFGWLNDAKEQLFIALENDYNYDIETYFDYDKDGKLTKSLFVNNIKEWEYDLSNIEQVRGFENTAPLLTKFAVDAGKIIAENANN